MAHKDPEGPEIKATTAIKNEDTAGLCELFNNKKWKDLNKSGFFDVKYYNSENIVFYHISVKEKNFNEIKKKSEEVNRFRNGYIGQHLRSVDIEEIVRVAGVTREFSEKFLCHFLDNNPFEKIVFDMTAKRCIYKKDKKKHFTKSS